jgi:hypothetical protein
LQEGLKRNPSPPAGYTLWWLTNFITSHLYSKSRSTLTCGIILEIYPTEYKI